MDEQTYDAKITEIWNEYFAKIKPLKQKRNAELQETTRQYNKRVKIAAKEYTVEKTAIDQEYFIKDYTAKPKKIFKQQEEGFRFAHYAANGDYLYDE